ncbi:MAG: poly(beta-D-mannuronate) O-acetylase, partial [Fibrobacteres bacterium]|nr:poly(beta-D-mannuronate) O-acetylase [Fibrobacterota bacterium]
TTGKTRRGYLIFSVLTTCAILFFFKYFNFADSNLTSLLEAFGVRNPIPKLKILLPIGLSFHTFQSLSYVFEVYYGRQKSEKNFLVYSLYVMFYPQLVAGPIERPQNLLHQFREHHTFDIARVCDGLKLMAWGLFKKVVIADRLSIFVNHIFESPHKASGPGLVAATVFFAFQIYCDFSGYSDMAIGAARVMGFRLMKNFDSPYLSQSISEFWRRWHISLSTWFKDYVYIPFGGNRVALPRMYLNLMAVFLISGLWHGANWTYIVWGLIHGFYLVFGAVTLSTRTRIAEMLPAYRGPIRQAVKTLVTFALVCIGWVFFRAGSLGDAVYILTHLNTGWMRMLRPREVLQEFWDAGLSNFDLMVLAAAILFALSVERWNSEKGSAKAFFLDLPAWVRISVYSVAFWGIFIFGVFTKANFIYFTF